MANTRIRYIAYDHSGGGVRHHHFGTQNNIVNEADGHASSGDIITAFGFPTLKYHGKDLPFAFMSVHGAADGNHLYTSPGNQGVSVGEENIDITVVYAPIWGSGGDGKPGIWVDAFNVDIGDFSDSDFITVLTPPTPPDTVDSPKTSYANSEGVVNTLAKENIRAYPTIDSVKFLEWKKIVPVEAFTDQRDIALEQNESGEIWFAFYQTVPEGPGTSFGKLNAEMEKTMGRWIRDDYCGTPYPHHIGPQGPNFQITLDKKTVTALSPAQKEKLALYVKEYPAVAETAYKSMRKVAEILKGVQSTLSNKR